MAIDPYTPCPCGSGKNFKWCCQSFYPAIEKAREQLQAGQKEAALLGLDRLLAKHPNRAVILGYQAEFYCMIDQYSKADEIIQKALTIDPEFPLGHWIRGMIRLNEGENVGALIELRKAAELYDPRAKMYLSQIESMILEVESEFNRPVAARFVLECTLRLNPSDEKLREYFEIAYGTQSRLPASARKSYSYRAAPAHRAEAWKTLVPSLEPSIRLASAIRAFEQLVAQDERDSAAWFNLGLARAWIGDHPKAIEALLRSIEFDTDESLMDEASALCQVLYCGEGMQNEGDYAEYGYGYELRDAKSVYQLLGNWVQTGRLIGVQVDKENGILSAILLDEAPNFVGGSSLSRTLCFLTAAPQHLRIWHESEESVDRAADELEAKLGASLNPPLSLKSHPAFTDITIEAMAYPPQGKEIELAKDRMSDFSRNFFEEIWVRRSLRSLSGSTPIDAAKHPTHRKRLGGLIRFLQECFEGLVPTTNEGQASKKLYMYDFDRLRRKLGLIAVDPGIGAGAIDFSALSAAELSALSTEGWDSNQLEQAFLAALRLDAKEAAGKFAGLATAQEGAAGSDRYFFYAHLMQIALDENDLSAVFGLLDAGEKSDRDWNEGRRRKDYTIRRGQTLAKAGEAEKAAGLFTGLIAEDPNELKYYDVATRTMLNQKQGQRALEFSEQGLSRAVSQNNRDLEWHFRELVAAARKQVG